jgi:hypothetical protein
VTEIDDFFFASANSSRRDGCRLLDRHDPSKQGLFCYPERRGVEFIAGVAAARDDVQHCDRVVTGAVPLCRHFDSEPTEPFADWPILSQFGGVSWARGPQRFCKRRAAAGMDEYVQRVEGEVLWRQAIRVVDMSATRQEGRQTPVWRASLTWLTSLTCSWCNVNDEHLERAN